MKKSDIELLNHEITSLLEKSGRPYSNEEEAKRWLSNYKNPKPKFKLYALDKKKFENNLGDFERRLDELSEKDQADFYGQLFKKTAYYSLGHVAIDHFKKKQKKKNPNLIVFWPKLKTWVLRVDNWAHADMIASLYCQMLAKDPKTVFPELEKWSQSKDPWKARMGIVSTLYYFNPKRHKPPYNRIERMLKPHLETDHYYLQKAIGWNLREVSRAYPVQYVLFMEKNILKISSTAFSTSVEKCPKERKEKWKAIRKKNRLKRRISY